MPIRIKMFETNSSSCHSICMGTGTVGYESPKNPPPHDMESKTFFVETGEFGWGPEKYRDFPTKLAYLVTGIVGSGDNGHFRTLGRILAHEFGFPDPYNWKVRPTDRDGYIDHESADLPLEILSDKEEVIWRFLFDRETILIIESDG